jgi:hypothetical protein
VFRVKPGGTQFPSVPVCAICLSVCLSGRTDRPTLHSTACYPEGEGSMVGAIDVNRFSKGLIYRGQGQPCRAPEPPVMANNTRPRQCEMG